MTCPLSTRKLAFLLWCKGTNSRPRYPNLCRSAEFPTCPIYSSYKGVKVVKIYKGRIYEDLIQELDRYLRYLEKLENIYMKRLIDTETYLKLKREYEAEVDKLESILKKIIPVTTLSNQV